MNQDPDIVDLFSSRVMRMQVSESKYSSIHEKIEPRIYSHLEYLISKGLIQKGNNPAYFNAKTDGYTSFYGENLLRLVKFNPIRDLIAETILESFSFFGSKKDFNLNIGNLWFTVYKRGQCVPWHTHPGSYLSGAYYFKVDDDPEKCGPIFFKDPIGELKQMVLNRSSFPIMDPPNHTFIIPKTGSLFLFPSWLPHKTNPNLSDSDRIIFSFNIMLEPLENQTLEQRKPSGFL